MSRTLVRLLALILVLAILSACGASTATTASDSASEEAASEETTAEAEAAEESEDAAADTAEEITAEEASSTESEIADEGSDEAEAEASAESEESSATAITYPLSEETTTLTFFCTPPDGPPIVEESWANLQIFQDVEELTNVHIEWQETARSAYAEKFMLNIASGDYADLIYNVSENYTGGIAKAYEDDVVIDLSELTETYAPDYSALAHTEDNLSNVLTDEGQELAICEIADKLDIQCGLFIRSDYLEELGLDAPATLDELTDAMVAIQSAYGCTDTILVANAISPALSTSLGGVFGVTGVNFVSGSTNEHFFIADDGSVTSTLVSDGFRDLLDTLNQWYTAGLFSYEALLGYETSEDEMKMTNGSSAVTASTVTSMTTYYSYAEDEDYGLTALTPLAREAGETGVNNFYFSSIVSTGTAVSVSSSCEQVELALEWLNYWYTEDGYMAFNYGPYGVSWEYDESGNPVYTEMITTDPDWGATTLIMKYNCKNRLFGYAFQDSNIDYYTDYQLEALEAFRTNTDNSRRLPVNFITLTTEETEGYSAYTDIATYASTEIMKFILGERDIAEWDAFQSELTDMGIYDCIAIYQAAYERYLNR